jgi:hypothetical protein
MLCYSTADPQFVVDIQGKPHHRPRRTLRPTDRNNFWFYKQTILQMPPQYYKFLLSWYDSRVFLLTSIALASANSPSFPQQGADDIDDLIRCMTANVDIG